MRDGGESTRISQNVTPSPGRQITALGGGKESEKKKDSKKREERNLTGKRGGIEILVQPLVRNSLRQEGIEFESEGGN